ncbi:hypothetical protein EYC80_009838 [Monilinia laxa]|uniref:Uncharacterized protein n=1 Tax=Monilinia laxa TaxID=61186 RepID=A0A5N6JSM0_MONLA|nr:hypothetical protein EYC80_009838 [Monilinia laxa]
MMRTKSQKVTVRFSGNVGGIREIAPAASCYIAVTDNEWVHSQATESSPQKAVFVAGVYSRWSRLVLPFGKAVKAVPQDKWNLHLRGDSSEALSISRPNDEFPEGQSLQVESSGLMENRLEGEER